MDERIKAIRESEKRSHIEMYSSEELYKTDSWLKKPIKTIIELMPQFEGYKELRVLDLGSGVGRNCISIAKLYDHIDCMIECVDILPLAIEKLYSNAEEYGVADNIHGVVSTIEDHHIKDGYFDLVIAVSALEHIAGKSGFIAKLNEIRDGVRENGIVCLVINSDVHEYSKATGEPQTAQFEVNLPTTELQSILSSVFAGWSIQKSSVREQRYDIPRENGISDLTTSVVTYVVRKQMKVNGKGDE